MLHLAPRLGQPVHRHREVVLVEPPGHLRVAEHHQPEQRQHVGEGGHELLVEPGHAGQLALGRERLVLVNELGRRHQVIDRLLERLDHGLVE